MKITNQKQRITLLSTTLANATVNFIGRLNGEKIEGNITIQKMGDFETYMSLPKLLGIEHITVIGLDEIRDNCYFISVDGGEKQPCEIITG